tara:strand:+ start:1261 stop:1698 length:438 start_codon:yes stop_codon:yes gene_type:complete
MTRKLKERPYGDGRYTVAGLRSFIMAALRQKSSRWAPKQKAKIAARDGSLINPKTGRQNIASKCHLCEKRILESESELDHIDPCVPVDGFFYDCCTGFLGYNWSVVIENMFCEADGYMVLCHDCHTEKSNDENELRRGYAKKSKI